MKPKLQIVWVSILLMCGMAAAQPATPAVLNDGPLLVKAASFVGGTGEDELVAAAVLADGSILLAGNAEEGMSLPGVKPTLISNDEGATNGFLLKLSSDGTKPEKLLVMAGVKIKDMKTNAAGNVAVLIDAEARVTIAGKTDSGTGIVGVNLKAGRAVGAVFVDKIEDFEFDANDDILILAGKRIYRYSGEGKERWNVTWKTHGDNRPGGIGLDARTGTVAVVGYGMTHTGKEPWKNPFAYAFDRGGNPMWGLWNPEPGRQVAKEFGGNGLMADTVGVDCGTSVSGDFYLLLRADGGNTVTTRDPLDPDKPLDEQVFKDVFQKTTGYGFKGASQTSVIFRVDVRTGALERGTFMSAWISPQRANSLFMVNAVGDEKGNVYLVGNSASGCPTHLPWFDFVEGGYQGGGFLAVLGREFTMEQCGYFSNTKLAGVARGKNGTVVVVGDAKFSSLEGLEASREGVTDVLTPTLNAIQPVHAGGERDGWFAVFKPAE
jgi:hypothetical protein